MTDGVQAIFVCLAHGVAIWPEDGALRISAIGAPLSPEGVQYIKRHKAAILDVFAKVGAVQVLNIHLREYGQRLSAEMIEEYHSLIGNEEPSFRDFMQTWAKVLYCDACRHWPE